jgi:ubiquinone biosynthesis monooxygenase Coq7
MTMTSPLPGDPAPEQQIERMIRVDHAGEYGAARIYAGQLAMLGRGSSPASTNTAPSEIESAIRHMAEQERRHLEVFDRLVIERRVRPTMLSPLWHIAGFALGAASALLGERAAMACTVAVEEVIDEHYRHQAEALGEFDPELKQAIEDARADEIEHRDIALAHGAANAPAHDMLAAAVKTGSRLAIWLSTRI